MKWYVNDNFVSRKLNGDDVVAECDSHKMALEIAAAHNLKNITAKIVEAALDKASKMPKVELFLRELQATDTDDYNIIRDRVAAMVEEEEKETAEATVLDLYEICSRIDEDIEGQYEDEQPKEPLDKSEQSSPAGWPSNPNPTVSVDRIKAAIWRAWEAIAPDMYAGYEETGGKVTEATAIEIVSSDMVETYGEDDEAAAAFKALSYEDMKSIKMQVFQGRID